MPAASKGDNLAGLSTSKQTREVPTSASAAATVIDTIEATLRELHAGDPDLPPITLDSVLDRDLSLDSLARMELLLRTERAIGIDLPADTLQRAETVADQNLSESRTSCCIVCLCSWYRLGRAATAKRDSRRCRILPATR